MGSPGSGVGSSVVASVVQLLQRLLAIDSVTLAEALSEASSVVAESLRADKVDAFLHDPSRDSLVAVGTSAQPLSALQRSLGLDVLAIANGGRSVEVFQTGESYFNNRVDLDELELRGVRVALGIRSEMGVALPIGDRRRGMVMVASQQPEFFRAEDVQFVESIARWVGLVAHRTELIEEISRASAALARREVAEELVTVLAHDLRNLLAPLSGRLEVIAHRARQEGRERDLRDAEGAQRTARRMDTFVTDMLDVTRLDQGVFAIHVDDFDLSALTAEIAATMASPRVEVVEVVDGPLLVAADRQRIRQCLENLTSNAVQHSPPHGSVTLTVSRFSKEGRPWASVEVRDRGRGIAAEVLPHIFKRFVGGGESRGLGLGLGLYLAKQIALAHGGDLTVESSGEQGTAFKLDLPCSVGD
jgi:two-component system OmpR family sensor kinase